MPVTNEEEIVNKPWLRNLKGTERKIHIEISHNYTVINFGGL
jgi:hypothetical protein